MEHLLAKSKSKNKNNHPPNKSSHDLTDYLLSINKKNKVCLPLKPKQTIKSKFFNVNLQISLPKLEEVKITIPKKCSSSSKLKVLNQNQNANIPPQKNNSKTNLPSINFPKLAPNVPVIAEKRRRSISFIKPTKKFYLDQKIIRDHSATSLAGKDEYGKTKTNQDSYLILTKINNFTNYNVFAVFDGHGPEGHLVSQFLVKYFTDFFKNDIQLIKCKDEPEIFNLFLYSDYKILRDAIKACEEQLSKEENINSQSSGSTSCIVIQIYKKIICMNIGDSRAILHISELLRDEIKSLSIDHKPNLKKEQERIKKYGGFVEQCVYEDGIVDGPFRVWDSTELIGPGLAISRSVGDFDASKLGVIAEPDFCLVSIKKEMNFIVVASDGIWEFLKNKNVCNIVKKFSDNGSAKEASEELVKKSREIWDEKGKEVDDITAIVIFL